MSKVVIVCQAIHCHTNDGVFVSPSNFVSLAQWWRCFYETVLVSPVLETQTVPNGWKKLPQSISVVALPPTRVNIVKRKAASMRALAQALNDASLVYLRMPFNDAYWAFKLAKQKSISVICEFHGDWSEAYLHQKTSDVLRRLVNRYRAWRVAQIYREVGRFSRANIVIGPVLKQRYLANEIPCLVTTNHTVRLDDFVERQSYALSEQPKLIFIGELQERKGLLYLLEALSFLDMRFELRLIGNGEQRSVLEAYCRDKGLEDQVRFLGYLPMGEAIKSELCTADLFVLPSVAAEGVPRVIQEAMAVGCPVIATDIGSTFWQLRDGAGKLVPSADVTALKTAIEALASDENQRRAYGRAGFLRAQEHAYERQMQGIHQFLSEHLSSEVVRPVE